MEFSYFELIHKTALDCAKGKKHQEIVTLLLNGPTHKLSTQTKEDQLKSELENAQILNSKMNSDNTNLKKMILELRNEIDKVKSFLLAFKEKPTQLESFNLEDYEEGSVIGQGAQSTVKEIIRREKYAKKELAQFDHISLQRFLKESEILVELRHPCIVRIVGVDYGDSSHPPSMVLSLESSSLEDSIQAHELSNEDKNRITVEIVLGMRYIHSKTLIHRDLKPANILLSRNKHVRISDFGLSKEESIEISQSKGVGTLRFMAPELFPQEEEDGDDNVPQEPYNSKVDVYSFGIVLIYIVTEQYPKYNMVNVLTGKVPKLPTTVVSWVIELIHRCLQLSPNDRPTFNEIFDILKSHNYDLFTETTPSQLTIQQRKSKQDIEHRILKIEAFEYQQQLQDSQVNH